MVHEKGLTVIAFTLGIALSMPLTIPAFSDSAPSNVAVETAPPIQRGLVRLRSGGSLMAVDAVNGGLDCYWTDRKGQISRRVSLSRCSVISNLRPQPGSNSAAFDLAQHPTR
jgi:uncharacterized protein YodC (DUF2158 family)